MLYPVQVHSSFPVAQRLASQVQFVVTVENTGSRPLPNVAVTITNPRYGTAAQAFATLIAPSGQGQPPLAGRSRPIWIVNQAPGRCGYSCRSRGPGAGATAYSNTWALGRLGPGRSVRFAWKLTAVRAGSYRVAFAVAPDLRAGDRATVVGGRPARGVRTATVTSRPPTVTVHDDGSVSSS